MDVAQVWSQHEEQGSQDVESPRSTSPNSPLDPHPVRPSGVQPELDHHREPEKERGRKDGQERDEYPEMDVKAATAGLDIQTSALSSSTIEAPKELEKEKDASLKLPDLLTPTEKKKSSWEKYSEFIMPALEEEWTPVQSPMSTLRKSPGAATGAKEASVTAPIPEIKRSEEPKLEYTFIDLLSTTLDQQMKSIKVAPIDLITFGKWIGHLFVFELTLH